MRRLRQYPYSPTQQATNGALQIYVAAHRRHDIREMLFGLAVLGSATEAQIHEAISAIGRSDNLSAREVRAMIAEE